MALDRGQLEAVKREAEKYKEAAVEANKAQMNLWEARFDLVIASGAVESVKELIDIGIVAWNDNNCSCGSDLGIPQTIRRSIK